MKSKLFLFCGRASAQSSGAITQTPATIRPYNDSLITNIDRLKPDVQRIIRVHYPADNRVMTMAELMKAVGK